ncbi:MULTISPECIES: GNAT family N-acetyltransferase [unclassified Microbacterium]|uniref:GNAT family N-acetyltransferase n=1 Tax=unclassified Microbacterium TaxID=2609290 RepID=UPI00214C5B61|nr:MULTISPECIES: GNAT family N-acetyltransferase [unclassified Microbacterium]MCR2784663.1 N-acetyltransferase [Microbacterium sp. zg.B96]WIM16205.1 GNAT family N-acetyltransferase [Microbacterium sp. zg-B96]
MADSDTPTTVTRDDGDSRYEIRLGGVLAGYTEFEIDPRGRLRFIHTEIDPAFRGRGVASALLGEAMADVARRGEVVEPLCPFVAKYLRENEVAGLVVQWPFRSGQDAAGEASA